jgi:hypothetical protein
MTGPPRPLGSRLRQVLFQRSDRAAWTYQVRLSSEIPEAQFQAVIEAVWPPGTSLDQALRSRAEQQLARVARLVAAKHSVLDCDDAWAAIDEEFVRNGSLRAVGLSEAVVTNLRAGPDDERLAEKQEDLRRETSLARAKAERLRELLADPVTARLWWLEDRPEKLEKLAAEGKDGIFEKVANLFGESARHSAPDPIAELIRLFLQGLDARFRERLIDQLDLVFRAYERADLADGLSSGRHPPVADLSHTVASADGQAPAAQGAV